LHIAVRDGSKSFDERRADREREERERRERSRCV
jgi:hypothetical protein